MSDSGTKYVVYKHVSAIDLCSTVTTWRDIADQLTPPQVAELEHYEHHGGTTSWLLLQARNYARDNMHDLIIDVPPPPDAVRWCCDGRTREFMAAPASVGDVTLRVCGRQHSDGATERWVELSAPDVKLSAAQVRALPHATL